MAAKELIVHLILGQIAASIRVCSAAVARFISFKGAAWILYHDSVSNLLKNLQSLNDIFIYQIELIQEWILRENESLLEALDVLAEDLPIAH